ncbi:Polysaccharide deacetylase [Cupriavidus oxalaticus]|uniref:hypothetical protein n=1 Tax=Cupriavidus oxalaticus TaxID=96344 RepID=UPI003F73A1AD
MNYPNGKKFAFTIFDDTDDATVANTKPVYDLLADCGLRTTKSTWIFPSRGAYPGQSLADAGYRDWLLDLSASGFEIGLHNVGDGTFTREEIAHGLEIFRQTFGSYPKVHTNHVSNPDNIYWWSKRFEFPINLLYTLAYLVKRKTLPPAGGDDPAASCYWGDLCREHVTYVRNLTVNHINTLEADRRMPYHIRGKPMVKYWFSSSDGHDVEIFNDLIREENVDHLEATGGACIVYTHFADGFVRNGAVDSTFARRIAYLSSKNGWFVPAGTLLDHLATVNTGEDPGYLYRLRTNAKWCLDRVAKRARFGK